LGLTLDGLPLDLTLSSLTLSSLTLSSLTLSSLTLSSLTLSGLTLSGLPLSSPTTLVGTSAAPTAGFSFGHLAPGSILGGGPSESCLLFRDRVPLEGLPLPLRGS
jgi:hypothetical protein